MSGPGEKDIDLQAEDSGHLLLLTMDNFKKKKKERLTMFLDSALHPNSQLPLTCWLPGNQNPASHGRKDRVGSTSFRPGTVSS